MKKLLIALGILGMAAIAGAFTFIPYQSRMVYSVLDYGADNTGTSDATAAINTTIAVATTAANASGLNYGTVVYFPPGQYKILSTVTISTNEAVSFLGFPYASYILCGSSTQFAFSFIGNDLDRRFVQGLYFYSVPNSGIKGNGIYINSLSFMKISQCQFQSLQYGLYTNGSEFNDVMGCTFNANTYGEVHTSISSDFLGRGPINPQNSAAQFLTNNEYNSNTVFGFYLDDTNANVNGDHQPATTITSCRFLSNGTGLIFQMPTPNNVFYNPALITGGWLEQNSTTNTWTFNGNTGNQAGLYVSGANVKLTGESINDAIVANNQSRINFEGGSLTGATMNISTDTDFSMNDVVADKQNGFNLDFAYATNLRSLNAGRPALARTQAKDVITYAGVNVVTAGSVSSAFGTLPTLSSGTGVISYYAGDGYVNDTCIKFTGNQSAAMNWQVNLATNSFYVTAFSIREDTFSVNVGSFSIVQTVNLIVPTSQNFFHLFPNWRTYASIGQSPGNGTTNIALQLLAPTTFYVSGFQCLQFQTMREAEDFFNSSSLVVPLAEMQSGVYVSTISSGYNPAAASNTFGNVVSTGLPGGDWTLSGCLDFNSNGSTTTRNQIYISAFSGNNSSDSQTGTNLLDVPYSSSTIVNSVGSCISWRTTPTGPTTYYLKQLAVYSVGGSTPTYFGALQARLNLNQ